MVVLGGVRFLMSEVPLYLNNRVFSEWQVASSSFLYYSQA